MLGTEEALRQGVTPEAVQGYLSALANFQATSNTSMTTDRSILRIRRALQTGDAADARCAFLTLPAVGTDFADVLAVVLRDAYANASISIDASIAFLDGFDNAEWALAGCGVLHGVHVEQQANSPFTDVPVFRLARFVKDIVATLSDDDKLRPRAEMLSKEWFSPTVRAVARGETIQIESLLRREILYAAANDLKFDATRRFVFTWCGEWYHDGNRSEHFVAEPVDDTWTRFALRSIPYNEYLMAELVEDANDPQHTTRLRVFSVNGHALVDVGAAGTWTLRSQDGLANREVFEVYNPQAVEHLQSPGAFLRDSSRRFVTTAPTQNAYNHDDLAQASQWLITPLQTLTPLEQAIDTFFQAKYADAEHRFVALADQSADSDTRVRRGVFQLASRLRRGQPVVNEVEFETLEALGGVDLVARVGLQDLWTEIATVVEHQRCQDADTNPRAYVEREMRRASRLVAAREYQSALEIFIEATRIAEQRGERTANDDDRDALQKIQPRAQLECAKMLFSLQRSDEALANLEVLQLDASLSNELAARALLWTAKCKRQGKCDWGVNLKLLQRALDKLAASETVSDGLRHSIVLEMVVANIAHQGPQTSARSLSAEKVIELCRCPISLEVMADPVVTPSGVSYEREMIEMHLRVNGHFDPMTHADLTTQQLYPNRMLCQVLEMALAEFDAVPRAW